MEIEIRVSREAIHQVIEKRIDPDQELILINREPNITICIKLYQACEISPLIFKQFSCEPTMNEYILQNNYTQDFLNKLAIMFPEDKWVFQKDFDQLFQFGKELQIKSIIEQYEFNWAKSQAEKVANLDKHDLSSILDALANNIEKIIQNDIKWFKNTPKRLLIEIFNRKPSFQSEDLKFDLFYNKDLWNSHECGFDDYFMNYVDVSKLSYQRLVKAAQFAHQDNISKGFVNIALEASRPKQKIKALCIVPNTDNVVDMNFFKKLNVENTEYKISPQIVTFSCYKLNEKVYLSSFDIFIIGGCDSAICSFSDPGVELKPFNGEEIANFLKIPERRKPILFLHDVVIFHSQYFGEPIFRTPVNFMERVTFANTQLANEYSDPFGLPSVINVCSTHETRIFDQQYYIMTEENNRQVHYYMENGLVGLCESGHSSTLSEIEKRLVYNIVVHLYKKSTKRNHHFII